MRFPDLEIKNPKIPGSSGNHVTLLYCRCLSKVDNIPEIIQLLYGQFHKQGHCHLWIKSVEKTSIL